MSYVPRQIPAHLEEKCRRLDKNKLSAGPQSWNCGLVWELYAKLQNLGCAQGRSAAVGKRPGTSGEPWPRCHKQSGLERDLRQQSPVWFPVSTSRMGEQRASNG